VGEGGKKAIVDRHGALLEAYDIAADPLETKEAKGDFRKSVVAMAKEFRSWLKGRKAVETKTQALDKEDEERLRALGYME
jgi:hypothetical protein